MNFKSWSEEGYKFGQRFNYYCRLCKHQIHVAGCEYGSNFQHDISNGIKCDKFK